LRPPRRSAALLALNEAPSDLPPALKRELSAQSKAMEW